MISEEGKPIKISYKFYVSKSYVVSKPKIFIIISNEFSKRRNKRRKYQQKETKTIKIHL